MAIDAFGRNIETPKLILETPKRLPPAGLEPATLALLAPCSDQLSYGGVC